MKITREQFKNIVREVMTEESEYQTFFKKALEKTGKSIPDMSDEEKKAFFNKIDAAWDGKGKKNEGNAFGAAVTKAKEEGDDEFEVGGEKFKVESVNEAIDIKVGDMVKVDNPHWEGALGKKGPFRRKVKGIYGDSVFFTDGSNSSMKYIKK